MWHQRHAGVYPSPGSSGGYGGSTYMGGQDWPRMVGGVIASEAMTITRLSNHTPEQSHELQVGYTPVRNLRS
jgi:hypothetical protein